MKSGKQTAALALGTILALSLTACGGTTSKPPADPIGAASEKLNAVKSMDATVTLEMDMSVMGESMETSTTIDMTYFSDPLKLKVEMIMDAGAIGSTGISMYAVANGDECTAYLYDGSSWMSQAMDVSDLEEYDAQDSMDLYLDSGTNYTLAGTEEINGAAADKYIGVIREDALDEVLAASGAADSLESGLEGMDLSELYGSLGELEVAVWVDQKSGYPVRYAMDMTELMQGIMEQSITAAAESDQALSEALQGTDAGSAMSFDKISFVMDCFNFDNATDFEIPAEALAA